MDDWDDWDDPPPSARDAIEEPSTAEKPSTAEEPSSTSAPSTFDAGSTDDEQAVRRYLTWIEDPSSLRDDARIEELQAKIDTASDPIEKIHLASELHRVSQVDGTELRQAFVDVARRWADANGIVPEAFLQLGVPAEDLREAGFEVPAGRTRRRSETGTVGGPTTSRPPATSRARRATAEDLRAGVRSFDGPFTAADLRDKVGGSPATVRKALESLVADGAVENLGPADDWPGPGRPPNRYISLRR